VPDLIAKPLLLAALVGAVALAGCINAPGAKKTDNEPLVNPPTTDPGNHTTNVTDLKPPVARMQVFNATGALVFESDFVASDAQAKAPVEGGLPIRFVGSNSEAVDKTATIAAWEWDFGDGGKAAGRSVEHSFTDTGGVFNVSLRVKDSNNLTDVLHVTLGATATRMFSATQAFDGTMTLGLPLGLVGLDDLDPLGIRTASHAFSVVGQMENLPVMFHHGNITITPMDPLLPLSTFNLVLLNETGSVVARSPSPTLSVLGLADVPLPSPGTPNVIELTGVALPAGNYTVAVYYELGVMGAYTLDVDLSYMVVNAQVDALFGGMSH